MAITHTDVEALLRSALLETDFMSLYDYDSQGTIRLLPSIDLAVILFLPEQLPVFGNMVFSRMTPQGYAARINPMTLAVQDVRWRRDRKEDNVWDQPVWNFDEFDDLVPGLTGVDFVCPYPASVLKLLVGIEILRLVDAERVSLDQVIEHRMTRDENGLQTQPLRTWLEEMLRLSDDRATFALLKHLHDQRQIMAEEADLELPCCERQGRIDRVNLINRGMADLGLETLQINNTRACDGSFYNQAGSGVGHIHMTAWDTARLLWLLDLEAPTPTWITARGEPVPVDFLSVASKRYLIQDLIGQQGFHEVLSTITLCGLPGVNPGIPALLPERWIQPNGSVILKDNDSIQTYSLDVGPCQRSAEVTFAHKTGLTQNYGSDVGIVKGIPERGYRRHYIIAFFSNLGYRYSDLARPQDRPYASGMDRAIWYAQVIPHLAHRIDEQIKRWFGE